MERSAAASAAQDGGYKWVVLANTTVGMLMATVNSSIVLISLPAIFRGIQLDPLQPANVSYLLWMLMGYMVVSAVLVVGLGRVGDMFGRVKMYNLGFAIFTAASIGLSLVFQTGPQAALELIGMRVLQGVGGALLMANSAAILTDAFPHDERGMALGINSVAAMAGSFIGLVVGGLLSIADWHLVFLVSVPIGIIGTVHGYWKLRETGIVRRARMDWWGNLTFAVGLVAVLVGITYGIQPYGGSPMGWTNPAVLAELIGGIILLAIFVVIEARTEEPMFRLDLFKIRAFTAGNIAGLLASVGRGGLMFMLIIWLQGIWLPLHGYSYESTPLWSAIYMLPLTAGFLVAGPASGYLSDRFGARPFATGGMLAAALSFGLFLLLPADFSYPPFAGLLLLNGLSMGLFASPNTAGIMNAVPPQYRGVGSGMRGTFQNAGMTLSIGLFFSLMVVGLSHSLPTSLFSGLTAHGVPAPIASRIADLPPVGSLFAAFLGYNPIGELLGPALSQLAPGSVAFLTGKTFFPHLIAGPFLDGMHITFIFAMGMMLVAAAASWMRGGRYVHVDVPAVQTPEVAEPEAPRTAAWWRERALAMPSPPLVVTISATYGAGGALIGRAVAERLGLPFLDRMIPAAVAERLTVTIASALARDDRVPGGAERILTALAGEPALYGITAATPGDSDQEEGDRFREQTEAIMWEMAATTGGVVLGRGSTMVLRGHPAALHVRLDGPPQRRLVRAIRLEKISAGQARERMRRTDRAHEAYMRQVYHVDRRDPGLYDLVIDSADMPFESCVSLIVERATGLHESALGGRKD